jgi:hypothetical protein
MNRIKKLTYIEECGKITVRKSEIGIGRGTGDHAVLCH